MSTINDLQLDIAELQSLSKVASRQKVKELLNIEETKLNLQLTELLKNDTQKPTPSTTQTAGAASGRFYQVQLRNYAWDQTNSFVKLYVTLQNVQTLAPENVYCNFLNDRSFELHVVGLENKEYVLTIKKLLDPINVNESSWKVKNDMVIVSLAKKKPLNWSHITEFEKKASDSKAPKFDDDKDQDPSQALMSMMKNLYNSGDDEMKRTIEKSWLNSQEMRDKK